MRYPVTGNVPGTTGACQVRPTPATRFGLAASDSRAPTAGPARGRGRGRDGFGVGLGDGVGVGSRGRRRRRQACSSAEGGRRWRRRRGRGSGPPTPAFGQDQQPVQVVGDDDVRPAVRGDVADGEAVRVAAVRVRDRIQRLGPRAAPRPGPVHADAQPSRRGRRRRRLVPSRSTSETSTAARDVVARYAGRRRRSVPDGDCANTPTRPSGLLPP